MHSLTPTCAGRSAADSTVQIHCRLKSSQYTLIISHKVIQLLYHSGSQRQGCARAIPSEASEVLTPKRHPFVFFFLPPSQESSALSQSEAMFVELGECSQNMLSEAFWTPNIASSKFDEYFQLCSRSKSSPN